MIVLIADTQHKQLNALGKERLNSARDQIESLRVSQARDHRQQRDIGVYREMRVLLQKCFVLGALLKRIGSKGCLNIMICGRIDFLIVNAIENTEQAIAARTQQMV